MDSGMHISSWSDREDAWEDLSWGSIGEVSDRATIAAARRTPDGRVSSHCSVVYCRVRYRLESGQAFSGIARFRGDGPNGPTMFTVTTAPGRSFHLILPPAPQFILSGSGPIALEKELGGSCLPAFPMKVFCGVRFEHLPEKREAIVDQSGLVLFLRDDSTWLDESINISGLFGERFADPVFRQQVIDLLSPFCACDPVVTFENVRAKFRSPDAGTSALKALREVLPPAAL